MGAGVSMLVGAAQHATAPGKVGWGKELMPPEGRQERMACPSTSAEHAAGMRVTVTAFATCHEVLEEMRARVEAQYVTWHDPHNNGTYSRRWTEPYSPHLTFATSHSETPQPTFGLSWTAVGHSGSDRWIPDKETPRSGVALVNSKLADAVKEKIESGQTTAEFTPEEYAAFGLGDLHRDHYIKSGDLYFRPGELMGDASHYEEDHEHQVR